MTRVNFSKDYETGEEIRLIESLFGGTRCHRERGGGKRRANVRSLSNLMASWSPVSGCPSSSVPRLNHRCPCVAYGRNASRNQVIAITAKADRFQRNWSCPQLRRGVVKISPSRLLLYSAFVTVYGAWLRRDRREVVSAKTQPSDRPPSRAPLFGAVRRQGLN